MIRVLKSYSILRNSKKFLPFAYALGCLFGITSCNVEYNISGDSDVTTLDGKMMYLKTPTPNAQLNNLDSCEVIHGKFSFVGNIDSTQMGEVYLDNEGIMPIVIETGNISISISSSTGPRIQGSTLNNRLYQFLNQKDRIEEDIRNLSTEEAQMIFAGINPIIAHKKVINQTNRLYDELENLETNFIITNSNNILGVSCFNMLCNQYPYPVMTSQIIKIMKKAHSEFKNNPQVKGYINAAQQNMKLIRESSKQ